jgi:D-alanyl-D-alanine carboxypeptidase
LSVRINNGGVFIEKLYKERAGMKEKIKIIVLAMVVLLFVGCESTEKKEPRSEEHTTQKTEDNTTSPLPVSNSIDNEWALWLIGPKDPFPEGYIPELSSIGAWSVNGEERKFDSRAAEYAVNMIEAARQKGLLLDPASSYRRISTQEENFKNWFNGYIAEGYSPEEAFAKTAEIIAIPRTSEHNAGLAIDFDPPETWFDQKPEFEWLSQNAHKYGFILRYPKNTIDITGISYEPWHWRFVGIYHAEKIHSSGLTLEEYIGESAEDDSVVAAFRQQIIQR